MSFKVKLLQRGQKVCFQSEQKDIDDLCLCEPSPFMTPGVLNKFKHNPHTALYIYPFGVIKLQYVLRLWCDMKFNIMAPVLSLP